MNAHCRQAASRPRQSGASALLVAIALACAAGAGLLALAQGASSAGRERVTESALAQAREALIAYAAERPIDTVVGPGYLPCPDLDDDGWAEPICGSLSGDRGQAERLGRLPWKTLGLADLRDGAGERLWYAVSTRYKGLLNCAASPGCVAQTPAAALGTITVRDPSGRVVHDGTLADPARGGAAAVVLAPGAPLVRAPDAGREARDQRRECLAPGCVSGRCVADPPWSAARCDPANYLDRAPAERSGEDNAAFHDRSDAARTRNADGFIHGPVRDAAGALAVNDRLAAVTWADVMARVMRRVAREAAACLEDAAGTGSLPEPEPACAPAGERVAQGRLPDAALPSPEAPGGRCAARAASPSWWSAWKPHVTYAPAVAWRAEGAGDCEAGGACLELVDGEGRKLASKRRYALVVGARAGECASARLECDARGCTRAIADATMRHEAVLVGP